MMGDTQYYTINTWQTEVARLSKERAKLCSYCAGKTKNVDPVPRVVLKKTADGEEYFSHTKHKHIPDNNHWTPCDAAGWLQGHILVNDGDFEDHPNE